MGATPRIGSPKIRSSLYAWAPPRVAPALAPMIRLDNISAAHGSQVLFVDASAALHRGEKAGLVGPNGAGKSTIFRYLMREESPDDGKVVVDKGVSLGYFSQDVGEMHGQSTVATVMDGAGSISTVARELAQLELAMADPSKADQLESLIERFGEVQSRFESLGGYALEGRAREILGGLGFSQRMMDGDVGELSGGWKMRTALARILLMGPDVLLLDEPTNHLDLESMIWLEKFLQDFDSALLMTCHDRAFMNRVCTQILEIEGGRLYSYKGNYDHYEERRAIADKQQQATFERQQAMLKKEQDFIARFKARASHSAQVQSRVKKLDKIEKVTPPRKRRVIEFEFRSPPRSGDDVLKLKQVNKAYPERAIYEDFSFLLRRKERWCVLGVNGAGKSTLLKMAAGVSAPDSGELKIGASVKLGYFAQHAMERLDGDKSVWESLLEAFPLGGDGPLRNLAGCFGFPGDEVDKKVSRLSGGEKARLVMALLMFDPPNFLILDEPTNHLDLDTKAMMIKALAAFEGSMLFVSHDRHFLSALSNRVLELTPDGPRLFTEGYDAYVESTGQEAPGVSS